jgi:hypothetical protein
MRMTLVRNTLEHDRIVTEASRPGRSDPIRRLVERGLNAKEKR